MFAGQTIVKRLLQSHRQGQVDPRYAAGLRLTPACVEPALCRNNFLNTALRRLAGTLGMFSVRPCNSNTSTCSETGSMIGHIMSGDVNDGYTLSSMVELLLLLDRISSNLPARVLMRQLATSIMACRSLSACPRPSSGGSQGLREGTPGRDCGKGKRGDPLTAVPVILPEGACAVCLLPPGPSHARILAGPGDQPFVQGERLHQSCSAPGVH